MAAAPALSARSGPVVVIGAGIGGLAAALRLASAGMEVAVLERHATPGGKIRQVGGVEAGPTVLTMKWVFDELFAAAGAALEERLMLVRQDVIARHFWPGSGPLDLYADPEASAEAVRAFAGPRAEADFRAFAARAKRLYDGFLDPVMRAPAPDIRAVMRRVAGDPGLVRAMAPGATLAGLLKRSFRDPRLRQLFGRYATYVGGTPERSPALLALICHAEAAGVWALEGGLSALAAEIARMLESAGGRICLNAHADRVLTGPDGVTGVRLADGEVLPAAAVVFNGDPRALALGLLGPDVAGVAPQTKRAGRSLSARVWSFRASWRGPEIVHHNVFFRDDPAPEFADLARGRIAPAPTLYLCAEDRGLASPPPGEERFEIIVNAAPLAPGADDREEAEACLTRTFGTLESFGAVVQPRPGPETLTRPRDFETLFPGSAGSLYGQSPHGTLAAFARPTARTRVPGLYLAGGGTHPGPGVPMAALSGRHAAAAILADRTSPSRSRPTATPGGTSTASATTGAGRSR